MIDRETVEHVAGLARLGLSEEEIEAFGAQLARILEYVDTLQSLPPEDLAAVDAPRPGAQELRLREDRVVPSLDRDTVLENAPNTESGYVKVPPIFDESA